MTPTKNVDLPYHPLLNNAIPSELLPLCPSWISIYTHIIVIYFRTVITEATRIGTWPIPLQKILEMMTEATVL